MSMRCASPWRPALRQLIGGILLLMAAVSSGLAQAQSGGQGGGKTPGAVSPNMGVCDTACPTKDVDPPYITFSPDGSTKLHSAIVPARISYEDYRLDTMSRRESLNGVSIKAQEDSFVFGPSSYDYNGNPELVEWAFVHLTLQPGSNSLYAYMCDWQPAPQPANCGGSTATLTFVPDTVVAQAPLLRVFGGASYAATFTVTNQGLVTYAYDLVPTCSGGATACRLVSPASPISLGPGDSVHVTVQFTSSPTVQSGTVMLAANYAPDPSVSASATVSVLVRPYAALLTSDSLGKGPLTDRGRCLTLAAGPGAAYECGDLRLVQPLPSMKTMGKERAPTLIYDSQFAHPYAVIGTTVSLPSGEALPDTVYGVLSVNGTLTGDTAKWLGTDWAAGSARRVAMAYDAITRPTGIYPYQLEIRKGSATRTLVLVESGEFTVVNRSASPFGAGWWLAGLESLDPSTMTWVGGDGSVRKYTPAGTNVWVAPDVDRPDTLRFDGTYYVRQLPHGAKVKFSSTGQQRYTVDRLGYQTVFTYASSTSPQLTSLLLASPMGSYLTPYSFSYTNGYLQSVTAPASRVSTVTDSAGFTTAITYPDGSTTHFGYAPTGPNLAASRTDALGHTVAFEYDGGHKLVRDSIYMGPSSTPIVTSYRPAETQGLWKVANAAAIPDSVFTRVDGPRAEADVTSFWLDRFGSPIRVRNALDEETLVYPDAKWPGLIAKLRYDNDRVLMATYDGHGNITSVVDSSTAEDSAGVTVYATTRYHWNARWDYPDTVITPAGVVTTFGYDDAGNRTWQQVGADTARRVWYYYYPGLPSGVGLLRATKAPLVARDSILYSPYGNLNRYRSPSGYWDTRVQDPEGHDTSDVVAIAAGDTSSSTSRTGRLVTRMAYDVMGRPTSVDVIGPAASYTTPSRSGTVPEQTLSVRTFYDALGLRDSVERWSTPDTNHIGISTTKWAYDIAGRVIAETTPDGRSDRTSYDPAGNVVEHVDRRGNSVRSSYDLVARLTRRISDAIFYADTTIPVYQFPRYANTGSGLVLSGDTATFTYDDVGEMLTADNGAAQIGRSYNLNGTLATDTLRIHTWDAPGDFTTHVYVNAYTYDRAGRRTSLTLPSTVGNTQRYTYDPITGMLGSVTDPLGNTFTFSYDSAARLDSLEYPGQIYERRYYDGGGAMARRLEVATNAFVGTDSGFAAGGIIHDDTLAYDARGKIVHAYGIKQQTYNTYSGLGALTSSYLSDATAPTGTKVTEEAYEQDALGNSYFTFDRVPPLGLTAQDPEYKQFAYEAHTGRLAETFENRQPSPITGQADTSLFDAAGNLEYYARVSEPYATDAVSTFERNYYDGLGHLAVSEKYSSDTTSREGGFEQYRYDALGRRVLRRWRAYWACTSPCYNAIERTVWDGDQLLLEIRQDGSDGLATGALEKDRNAASGLAREYYGVVSYTHAGGIDQPLDLIRYDYNSPWSSPFAVIPHDNWRGLPDLGSFANGTAKKLTTDINGNTDSLHIDWPARTALATYRLVIPHAYRGWFGSLITQKRDDSGQLYMRNRYYDPVTGRFTQEDPIGLAGGLNAYGFAVGDPVSYSDPFGLKVCFGEKDRGKLVKATEAATNTSITLGKDGCVASFKAGKKKGFDDLRKRFGTLVSSDNVYTVLSGDTPRVGQFVNNTATLDFVRLPNMHYPVQVMGQCVNLPLSTNHQTPGSTMAHELLGHAVNGVTDDEAADEEGAVNVENEYHAAANEPTRCAYEVNLSH